MDVDYIQKRGLMCMPNFKEIGLSVWNFILSHNTQLGLLYKYT